MKRFISFALAMFMVLNVAPLSLAMPMKDATLDPVLNGEGGNLTFVNDSANPWVIEELEGVSYAKTDIMDMHSTTTTVKTIVDVEAHSVIRFDYITSTERTYDKFIFEYVKNDGSTEIVLTESGETADTFIYAFPETIYGCELRWSYSKDGSASNGDDCVYLTNIVFSDPVEAEDINIVEENLSMKPGMEIDLTVELTPSYAASNIVWQSSNDEFASVVNGVVRANAIGEATITATAAGHSDTVRISVTDDVKHLDGFRVSSWVNNYPDMRFANYVLGDGRSVVEELPFSLNLDDVSAAAYYNRTLYVVLDTALYTVDYETAQASFYIHLIIQSLTYHMTM